MLKHYKQILLFTIAIISLFQIYSTQKCDVQNCLECNPTNPKQCKFCKIDYFISVGICYEKNYKACFDSDCITCKSSFYGTCTQCIQGYFPTEVNSCEWKCGSKCKKCSEDFYNGDKCSECVDNLVLESDGNT